MKQQTESRRIFKYSFLIIVFAVVSCATLPEPSKTVQNLLVGEVVVDAKNYNLQEDGRISINGVNTKGITLSITNYRTKTTTIVKSDEHGFFYATALPAGVYCISNILLEKKIEDGSGGSSSSYISTNPSAETMFVLKPRGVTNIGKIIWETDAKKSSRIFSEENYSIIKTKLADMYPESKWLTENWRPVKIVRQIDFDPDLLAEETTFDQVKKPRLLPADFRNDRIEKIVRQVPKVIAEKQKTDPDGFLADLVVFLTKDSPNTFETVKRLHDWVADNIAYDTPSFLSGKHPDQDYKTVLNSKLAVCEGFANLFKKLCDLKGISCTVVQGYSRGYGTSVFSNEDPNKPNHAWNIVTINRSDYLVDTTWDAGYIENNSFKKHYNTGYLFAEPIAFLHSHYPVNSQYQLVSNPVNSNDFSLLPALNSNYFSAGIVSQTKLKRINRLGNDFAIQFKVPAGTDMRFSVYDPVRNNEVVGSTFKQQDGDIISVNVALPRPGNYILRLFKHQEKDITDIYIGCGEIGLVADRESKSQFPVVFSSFLKEDQLLSPIGPVVIPGKEMTFRVKFPGVASAFVIFDDRTVYMKREDNNVFSLTMIVPNPVSSVIIAKSGKQSGSKESVLQFPVLKD